MVEKQIPETIRDTHPGFVDATVGTYEEIKGKITEGEPEEITAK